MRHSILLIDDDEQVTDVLSMVLEADGYEIRSTSAPVRALELLQREDFSLVLLDLRLGDHNGLDLLPRIREIDPNVPIFMITAHGDLDSAVSAFSRGATGYVKKPFVEGELKAQIAQAAQQTELRRELKALRGRISDTDVRSLIRSRDSGMDALIQRVATAAQVNSNVVVTGESGTGKELVAKALHQCGPRAKGPFIAFNCAALPETLLESELFGHVRGAFTDARESKPGLFQRANGGTLFLDEIGDAPLSIQAKLLRVLQEREILPVGATQPVKVDVRVVVATHKSLQEEVTRGRFRQDLYFRLHVLPIHIPPLRERRKDIMLLAGFFATRIAEQMGIAFQGFTPGADQALTAFDWPGNVRELQNRVEQALAMSRGGGVLSAPGLFPERDPVALEQETSSAAQSAELLAAFDADGEIIESPGLPLPSFSDAKRDFERSYLERVLGAARGNIAKAARLASKSRTEVYSLLQKHNLDPLRFKQSDQK